MANEINNEAGDRTQIADRAHGTSSGQLSFENQVGAGISRGSAVVPEGFPDLVLEEGGNAIGNGGETAPAAPNDAALMRERIERANRQNEMAPGAPNPAKEGLLGQGGKQVFEGVHRGVSAGGPNKSEVGSLGGGMHAEQLKEALENGGWAQGLRSIQRPIVPHPRKAY